MIGNSHSLSFDRARRPNSITSTGSWRRSSRRRGNKWRSCGGRRLNWRMKGGCRTAPWSNCRGRWVVDQDYGRCGSGGGDGRLTNQKVGRLIPTSPRPRAKCPWARHSGGVWMWQKKARSLVVHEFVCEWVNVTCTILYMNTVHLFLGPFGKIICYFFLLCSVSCTQTNCLTVEAFCLSRSDE